MEKTKVGSLCFMLSQLRDDLGEIVDGVEAGELPYEVAVAGAQVQLTWVLNELNRSAEEG